MTLLKENILWIIPQCDMECKCYYADSTITDSLNLLDLPCVGTVLTSGSIQGDDDTSETAQRKHFVDHPPMRHGVQMLLCRLHNHRLLESFGLGPILDQRTHHLNASKLVTDGGVEFATIFAVINSNFLSKRAGCHSMVACNKLIWRAL